MFFWLRFIVFAGILHSPALSWCQALLWPGAETTIFFNQSVPPIKTDNLGYYFLKDSRGFVWLSSFEGVVRFDGLTWATCPPRGFQDSTLTRTIGSNVNSPFFEDANGDIWFSTETAVNRYEVANGHFFALAPPSQSAHTPALLYLEKKRFLWAAIGEGRMARYDLQNRAWQDQPMRLPDGFITVPCTSPTGDLAGWLSHPAAGSQRKGLTFFPIGQPGEPPPVPKSFLKECLIHKVLAGARHTIAASDQGLWEINLRTGVAERCATELDSITSIAADKSGAYWLLGSGLGLWHWTGHRDHAPQPVRLKFHTAGFDMHHADQLHTDQDGIVWVVYSGQGLAFAQPDKNRFRHQDLSALGRARRGLGDGRISCLSEGSENRVLLVFDNQAVAEFDVQSLSLTRHTLRGVRPGGLVIFQCYKHSDGAMYLATTKGVFKRQGNTAVWQLLLPQEAEPPMIFWLFAHPDGRILGASKTSVFEVRPAPQERVGFHLVQNVLKEGMIYFGDCDREGTLFLNTDDTHLTIVKPGGQPQKLPFSSFWGMVQDKKTPELHWLATATGLYGIDLRTLTVVDAVNAESGLPNQYLYRLTSSDDGDLWASTSNGLFRYTPSSKKLRVLMLEDGLAENAFVEKSLLILPRTQHLVAASLDHINFARLADIGESEFKPPISITEIQINDAAFESGGPSATAVLPLRHSQNTVSLRFVGIDYSAPDKVRLKYRLSGYDPAQHWVAVPPGTPGFARYANLPPGQYQLQIMAANSDGVWSEEVKTLDITILPPWWQTWWFQAAALTACLLAAYGFYRYRLGQLRRRLEQRNRMTLLELDALRAQLNPHFISNSLVAINYYIRNNGVERVRQYVNTLARLMRDVLTSARQASVSVDEELAMLRNYVEVESGQFLQPIDFEVVVAEGIPTDKIQMPGMLLQPFVENAIKHGLKPRHGQGCIRISVQRASDALLFTISDDGVGRQHEPPPAEEQDDGAERRKSHGLEITRQRLQLYDQYQETAAPSGFEIEDLRHADGSAAGTEVRLRLFFPKKSDAKKGRPDTTFAA